MYFFEFLHKFCMTLQKVLFVLFLVMECVT